MPALTPVHIDVNDLSLIFEIFKKKKYNKIDPQVIRVYLQSFEEKLKSLVNMSNPDAEQVSKYLKLYDEGYKTLKDIHWSELTSRIIEVERNIECSLEYPENSPNRIDYLKRVL